MLVNNRGLGAMAVKDMLDKRIIADGRERDDSGAVLITVLMVALFFFLAVITVATYATYSVRDTNLHKSRVISYASAEGARDQALADLQNANCSESTVVLETGGEFSGEYQMYWAIFDEDEDEIPNDVLDSQGNVRDNFEPGCASSQDASDELGDDEVIYTYIVAKGNVGGIEDEIVSVYELTHSFDTFEYSISSFGTINFGGVPGIYEPSGEKNVVLAEGSLLCTSLSVVEGSVYLMDPRSNSQLGNCGRIAGDVHTAGDIRINGGNQGIVIEGDLCVEGRVIAAHHLGIQQSVAGRVTTNAGPGGCPTLELAKENMWVDYNPDLSGAYRATADMCINRQNFNAAPWYDPKGSLVRFMEEQRRDVVIDLTHCTQPLNINGWTAGDVNLRANITLVTDRVDRLNSINIRSGDGGKYNFNIIVPDRNTTTAPLSHQRGNSSAPKYPTPHCDGRKIDISMLDYDRNTAGLIYSPCGGVKFENKNFRGQLYLGADGFNGGAATFTHVDVEGLPTNNNASSTRPPQVSDLRPVSQIER